MVHEARSPVRARLDGFFEQEVAMRGSGLAADDLRCIEFFSVVTDDLDGEANEDDRRRIDKHPEHCQGCRAALEQFQAVIGLAVNAAEPMVS